MLDELIEGRNENKKKNATAEEQQNEKCLWQLSIRVVGLFWKHASGIYLFPWMSL